MNRAVIVTGAASGIGRAVAGLFAEAGDRLALVDVDVAAARAVSQELAGEPVVYGLDVANSRDVTATVTEIAEQMGRIDVLCNVAGVLDGYARIAETSDDLWEKVLGVNLSGPFHLCRAAIPVMRAGGGGAIVNTASISGLVAGGGGVAYTASKHGVIGLTRQLALDHGKHGIRVNAVCPGPTRSGMTEYRFTEGGRNDRAEAAIARAPAGRWAEPIEIARVIRWLASDEASFVHGAAYMVDGGWTIA